MLRRFLGFLARQAIDDAAFAAVTVEEIGHLPLPFLLHLDRQLDIRPVEAEHHRFGIAVEQTGDDIVAGHGIGRGGQRRDRYAGEGMTKLGQLFVFRAERRSPLRNAMGFVDGEQADIELCDRREHAFGHQTFRRHVEQPGLARRRAAPGRHVVFARPRRVDGIRCHAGQFQRRDLVFHQGDQRRDHDRQSAGDQ